MVTTKGFRQQTQKLEQHYMSPLSPYKLTLGVKYNDCLQPNRNLPPADKCKKCTDNYNFEEHLVNLKYKYKQGNSTIKSKRNISVLIRRLLSIVTKI